MSGREQGKALLASLSAKVRDVLEDDGEIRLHRRGVEAMVDLAQDLTGDEAPPGLVVQRDGGARLKVLRKDRPGMITFEWQRSIGALVTRWERNGKDEGPFRFLHRESDDCWIEKDSGEELYTWLTRTMGDVLYPDSTR
ncbi:MAG: hypothetical protein Q8Q09_25270 [Deltaproteobacteria bacterium]|nr:hypothetical protein [Deltaproteobacteria bacterium]